MKTPKILFVLCLIALSFLLTACSGGGGSSGGTGTVTMSVTDAKPLLPENVTNLFVTFSEVWVHKPGEGWKHLPLVESPYTIDLLQFHDGNFTELVPPTKLSSGKYTQVRIVVDNATMRSEIRDDAGKVSGTEDLTLEIPGENLKTDKNFTIDLKEDAAMDIVIHFDLSMSVVASGPASDPQFALKPVLHLFEDPLQAATIEGRIDNDSFLGDSVTAIIVVKDSNGDDFTRVEVSKNESDSDDDPDSKSFSIFWLIPDQSYTVYIDLDTTDGAADCSEPVDAIYLEPGAVFELNEGKTIEKDEEICS